MVKCRDCHSLGPWSTCSVALREEKRCCVQKRSSIHPLHQGTERSSCGAERRPPPHGVQMQGHLGWCPKPTPVFQGQPQGFQVKMKEGLW